MGNLIYTQADLLTTDKGVIAHGVNCKGRFASGVAAQIARRFPEAKRSYMRKYHGAGWHLGEIQAVLTDSDILVVNMATQETFGRKGVHVNYDAVRDCFTKLFNAYQDRRRSIYQPGVAIPKIGCGLGGGEWEKVEPIILECLGDKDIEVEVFYL